MSLLKAPAFWYRRSSFIARLLSPLGWLYHRLSLFHNSRSTPWRSPVPVICIGNANIGGTGKTPVGLWLAGELSDLNVHAVLRGYGGSLKEVTQIEPAERSAADVGDEAMLYAAHIPTWTGADRAAAVARAAKTGADLILLDDGLQNGSIHKDYVLLIVDAATGFGNGRVLPAGPLREPPETAIAKADRILLTGTGAGALTGPGADTALSVPQHTARFVTPPDDLTWLNGRRVHAFAGIGRPQKFFNSLEAAGAQIVKAIPLGDHARLTEKQVQQMLAAADNDGADLVCTAKDYVKVSPPLRSRIRPIGLELSVSEPEQILREIRALGRPGQN